MLEKKVDNKKLRIVKIQLTIKYCMVFTSKYRDYKIIFHSSSSLMPNHNVELAKKIFYLSDNLAYFSEETQAIFFLT